MAIASHKSVFISYARKDGARLANRLLSELRREGFDVWLDTQEIAGGVTWTREIEEALDGAQVVLALLTSGSYKSEICRAEQLRALRHGKCMIPLALSFPVLQRLDLPLLIEGQLLSQEQNLRAQGCAERNRRRKKRSTSPARSVIKLGRESSERFAFGRNRDMGCQERTRSVRMRSVSCQAGL